jgi:hypothetical protein
MFNRSLRKGQSAKMGNEKVSLDGYSFGSKLEASVYQILKLRMKAGEIAAIQVQDHIYLTDAKIGYIPDFKCTAPDGSFFWVEAKGYANDRWPMKKKLWKFYGPGVLEIWMGHHANPKLTETIVPREVK